jgi:hypothetical protein
MLDIANDIEPSQDIDRIAATGEASTDSYSETSSDSGSSEDEYVYDVYYRDVVSRTGPQGAAESGLQPAAVAGHQRGFSGAAPERLASSHVVGGEVVPPEAVGLTSSAIPGLDHFSANAVIAHLEGFLDSEDDLEQAEEDGLESYDEGEDEDSNDEGFYRNDYPEQELPDEEEIDFGYNGYDDSDGEHDEDDPYGK